MFVAEEATLVEVNPLIVTPEREVKALDAKVTLDDNALYRHADNAELRDPSKEDPQERMAKERGADLRQARRRHRHPRQRRRAFRCRRSTWSPRRAASRPTSSTPGGGSRAEAITSAVEVILSDAKVKAVLFNIFGGITRGDEVATGA